MKKLLSRRGFTQNPNRVWGHCEANDTCSGFFMPCTNQTLFRCDICRQFICNDHQKFHAKSEHSEVE
jgi:hypothetical protein